MANLSTILLTVFVGLVTAEVISHAPRIARWLIGRAARHLDDLDCDRYREEWLAHADDLPGPLSKIFHALDCLLRGAGRIARARETRRITKYRIAAARAYAVVKLGKEFGPPMLRYALKGEFWKCRLSWTLHLSIADAFVHNVLVRRLEGEKLVAEMKIHFEKLGGIISQLKAKFEENAAKRAANQLQAHVDVEPRE